MNMSLYVRHLGLLPQQGEIDKDEGHLIWTQFVDCIQVDTLELHRKRVYFVHMWLIHT